MKQYSPIVLAVVLTLLFCFPLMAQDGPKRLVSGVVVDAQGECLPQVRVEVKESKRGGVTNVDGYFSFSLTPQERTLVFSFIGMKTKEVNVSQGGEYRVVLEEDSELLDELIVTGYQTISQERATGSFAVINPSELKGRLQSDVMSRLEGQVPGLVQQGDGSFFIRGIATLRGETKPLIVVDGMPYEGDLKSINPSTVTKVTVLKDAAAASIYGARAANGVIVINTLSGSKDGALHITYDASLRMTSKPDYSSLNLMSTSELIDLQRDAFGLVQTEWDQVDKRYFTNPVNELLLKEKAGLISMAEVDRELSRLRALDNRSQLEQFYLQMGLTHQHNVALSGGNDKHRYVASLNYIGDRGTAKYATNERIGFTLRNDMKFLPWLSADISIAGSFNSNRGDSGMGTFESFLRGRPSYYMLYDEAGNANSIPDLKSEEELSRLLSIGLLDEHYSPVTNRQEEYYQNKVDYYRIQAGLNFKLIEGLDLDVRFQTEKSSFRNKANYTEKSYTVRNMVNDAAQYDTETREITYNIPLGGQMSETRGERNSFAFRPQLNYFVSKDEHYIQALAGGEVRAVRFNSTTNYYMGYDDFSLGFKPINPMALTPARGTESLGGSFNWVYDEYNFIRETEDRYLSLYANASYTYAHKFNVTGSIRMDQSNLFGTDPRYQYRPLWSVGTSYDLAQEAFLKATQWVDVLKLRLTYGIGGNVPKDVGPYLIFTAPSYNNYLDDFGSGISSPPNDQLRWEKTATTNIALDFALFSHRLTGSIDFYNKHTSDLLANRDADPTLGWNQLMLNYGTMYNRGVELSLVGNLIDRPNFSWQSMLNFSYNKNRLLDVDDSNTNVFRYTGGRTNAKGYPSSALFSFPYAGLSAEDGTPLYYDKEGEKVSEINSIEELIFSGTTIPTMSGAWTNDISFYHFDLSFMFSYLGGHVVRKEAAPFASYAPTVNSHRGLLNRWQKPGDELDPTTTPAILGRNISLEYEEHPWRAADTHIAKADYLKLRTLSLSYTFDPSWLTPLYIEGLTLTFSADDLFVVPLNGDGVNPEALSTYGYGWGLNSFPSSPTYYIGLQVIF